jgi:ABC-2 type transport system ATP-binding protein
VLHRESLGRVASVTVLGAVSSEDRAEITASGLDLAPVSLQQLVVRLTQKAESDSTRQTIAKEEVR